MVGLIEMAKYGHSCLELSDISEIMITEYSKVFVLLTSDWIVPTESQTGIVKLSKHVKIKNLKTL